MRRWLGPLVVLVAASCSSGGPTATSTTSTAPTGASAAVATWFHHLAAHDDPAAYADLAPASQAAVGDVTNYERGSGRFGSVYARFAASEDQLDLRVDGRLVIVVAILPGPPSAVTAVPVRLVAGQWRVDPILDVGSYAVRPDDGAAVGPRPSVSVQLDDPATRARVWFDRVEATATSGVFRPSRPLSPGRHLATIVLRRSDDVVAHTIGLEVQAS